MDNIHGSQTAVGICFNSGTTLNLASGGETFFPQMFCCVTFTVRVDVTGALSTWIFMGFMYVFGPLYVRVVGSPQAIT